MLFIRGNIIDNAAVQVSLPPFYFLQLCIGIRKKDADASDAYRLGEISYHGSIPLKDRSQYLLKIVDLGKE